MLNKKALAACGAVSEAITYVGGTTASITASTSTTTNVSLTSLSGGVASQPIEGDLVVVYYGTGSTSDRAISVTTSGYTQVAKLYANDNFDANLYVGYKVMGSTPDTQVTVSATLSTSDEGAVAVHVWRNVDTILPLDVAAVTATGISSVLCNPPAITPNTAGSVILAGGAGAHNRSNNPTFSSSDLSNFISPVGVQNATNDVTIGLGSYAWTSGAFDPTAFTFSGSDSGLYSWAAVTLALRPKYTGTVPEFVASASTQNAVAGATLVIDKPAGTIQGDLMIAIVSESSKSGTWTGDTSWTEVGDLGSSPGLRIAYKVAGASEGSSYTFTFSDANAICSGCILTYRYAAYDTIGSFDTSKNPLVLTGITTAADFSILIASGARAASGITLGTPSNMTPRVTDADGTAPSYIVCDQYVIAGATGTRSMTTGSTTNVVGIMLSIKPA